MSGVASASVVVAGGLSQDQECISYREKVRQQIPLNVYWAESSLVEIEYLRSRVQLHTSWSEQDTVKAAEAGKSGKIVEQTKRVALAAEGRITALGCSLKANILEAILKRPEETGAASISKAYLETVELERSVILDLKEIRRKVGEFSNDLKSSISKITSASITGIQKGNMTPRERMLAVSEIKFAVNNLGSVTLYLMDAMANTVKLVAEKKALLSIMTGDSGLIETGGAFLAEGLAAKAMGEVELPDAMREIDEAINKEGARGVEVKVTTVAKFAVKKLNQIVAIADRKWGKCRDIMGQDYE